MPHVFPKKIPYSMSWAQLVAVLEARKKWFDDAGCDNLDAFNKATGRGFPGWYSPVTRWRNCWTGQAGARRTETSSIGSKTGLPPLHAWGGPLYSLDILHPAARRQHSPGQTKNNMDFRVCGRAESVLSGIILTTPAPPNRYPKDARGRFITGDGTVFQAYYMEGL